MPERVTLNQPEVAHAPTATPTPEVAPSTHSGENFSFNADDVE
jgi:hypothetical protein